MDVEGRPALRGRHRGRHERAGLHHREHQRRGPAGVPHVRRRARLGHGQRDAWHRQLQPGDARPRRAARDAAQAHPAAGHGHAAQQARRHLRQGQGRRRGHRDHGHRRRRRLAALHALLVGVHPRRGRLGRRPWPLGAAERAARARARPRGHLPDVARSGPRLPPLRRPQPAALRPGVRGDGRLRPPDPARAVHLRVHRPRPAPHAVRLGPGPLPATWRAASRRPSCPATP